MVLCAWLTPFFLSHDGGLAGSLGRRANSLHSYIEYFGSFASSPATLKLQEDTEDPSLKAVFDEQILVSDVGPGKTYVNSKRQFNRYFLSNNTGAISLK